MITYDSYMENLGLSSHKFLTEQKLHSAPAYSIFLDFSVPKGLSSVKEFTLVAVLI